MVCNNNKALIFRPEKETISAAEASILCLLLFPWIAIPHPISVFEFNFSLAVWVWFSLFGPYSLNRFVCIALGIWREFFFKPPVSKMTACSLPLYQRDNPLICRVLMTLSWSCSNVQFDWQNSFSVSTTPLLSVPGFEANSEVLLLEGPLEAGGTGSFTLTLILNSLKTEIRTACWQKTSLMSTPLSIHL